MIYLLVFLCSLYFVSLYENNGYCFVKNKYSNVYILKGSLTEEQALKEIEIIKGYFKGAEIYEDKEDLQGYQGRKKLAYRIKDEEYGYYYITYFKSTFQKSTKIEEKLKANENVMKFITVKMEG